MRRTRTLTICALFTALTAVCAQIQIPMQPVMLNLALLAVHLASALLTPSQASAAMLAYLLMGALGLPVFAGFRGGFGVLLDRTGGYIAGYVLSAWLAAWIIRRRGIAWTCAALSAGTLACYTAGTAWFMLLTSTPLWTSLTLCVIPFIPGDIMKILLAALLARRLRAPLKHMIQ